MTKKLIALISTKNKSIKQITEESVNAVNKYKEVERSTRKISMERTGQSMENNNALLKENADDLLDQKKAE